MRGEIIKKKKLYTRWWRTMHFNSVLNSSLENEFSTKICGMDFAHKMPDFTSCCAYEKEKSAAGGRFQLY